MYIQVEKSNNVYNVTPNVTPSVSIPNPPTISGKFFKLKNSNDEDAYVAFIDADGNYITDKSEVVTSNIAYIYMFNIDECDMYNHNLFAVNEETFPSLPTFNSNFSYFKYLNSYWDQYGGINIDGDTFRFDTNSSDQVSGSLTGWNTTEVVDSIPITNFN